MNLIDFNNKFRNDKSFLLEVIRIKHLRSDYKLPDKKFLEEYEYMNTIEDTAERIRYTYRLSDCYVTHEVINVGEKLLSKDKEVQIWVAYTISRNLDHMRAEKVLNSNKDVAILAIKFNFACYFRLKEELKIDKDIYTIALSVSSIINKEAHEKIVKYLESKNISV